MPAACSLLLEVYEPVSVYDDDSDSIAWEVSSDPAHDFPYLLGPTQYAEQEIDPIKCTASIGTVQIGVIDVPTTPGNQATGWMTARIHSVLGRRCRLRRWVNDDIGWVTIADGPAGAPKMDGSYAAYRWPIRDTRETERKLFAFNEGGVQGIAPRGAIYGFGQYTDDDGDHILLPRAIDTPIRGVFELSAEGSFMLGLVNMAGHFTPGDPATIDDPNMVVTEAGQKAIQLTEIDSDVWGAANADVLWRLAGSSSEWNVARPVSTTAFQQPFVGTAIAMVDGFDDPQTVVDYVTLFYDADVPEGFPTESGAEIEVVVRYRGAASEDFPYYAEGPLGDVLQDLYSGVYSLAPTAEIGGFVYDPAEQDISASSFITRIRFDPSAFALMTDQVMLRQTENVPDSKTWAETNLYGPSGWIPALDNDMQISPVSRNRPSSVDESLIINDDVTVPTPNWSEGEQTVSQITYTYNRYFIPDPDAGITVAVDGLAVREVDIEFDDAESELRYGAQPEDYDASAFSAVGLPDGSNIPGQLETANLMAQTAKFEVLDRYRAGVQSVSVQVLRVHIPTVRVGDWVPWSIMQFPDRLTGFRGSSAPSAQVISLRDDNCTWRTLVLEESEESAGEPGAADLLEVFDDSPGAGSGSLMVDSDEESS